MNKRLQSRVNIIAKEKRLIVEVNLYVHKTKIRCKAQGTRQKTQGLRTRHIVPLKFIIQSSLLRIDDNIFFI